MNSTKALVLIITTGLSFLLNAPNLYAQRNCGTDAHQEKLMQNPDYKEWFERKKQEIRREAERGGLRSFSAGVNIPIAVHYESGITSNMDCLEDAAIAQVAVLNADLNAMNTDIVDYVNIATICSQFDLNALFTGIGVTFNLATHNHPPSSGLSDGDYAITVGEHAWPSAGCDWSGYLNIFVNKGFPDSDNQYGEAPIYGALNPDGNGIRIRSDVFGGPDFTCPGANLNNNEGLDRGRTGTHEVGHYFGLEHIFHGPGCAAPGDGIADTPPQATENLGAPTISNCITNGVNNTCNPEYYMNYMDYVNDASMVMFTVGQAAVMCPTASGGTWKTGTTGGSVTHPVPFQIVSEVTTPTSCVTPNGTAVILINGGISGSAYVIDFENTTGPGAGSVTRNFSNTLNNVTLTGLASGTWTYTITNGGCTSDGTFVIENDFKAIAVSTTNAACIGVNDGIAEIEFLGGAPSLDYAIEYENTTGPGQGFDDYFFPGGPESVELTDLAAGVWTYTATNGICEYSGTFEIESAFKANAVPLTPATCNGVEGSVKIDISGGDPSYDYVIEYVNTTGNGDGADEYFFPNAEGTMIITELSGGFWTYIITNGDCVIEGDFEIEQLDDPAEGVDCEAFNAIWAVPSMSSNGYWSKTVVSSVHARIMVELGAATIPDGVRVTVTGADGSSYSEYWTAGYHDCDGYDYNGDHTTDYECRTFGIAPCDKVKIEVFTDVCKLDPNSAWNLNVYCGKSIYKSKCRDRWKKLGLTDLDKLEEANSLLARQANQALIAGALKVMPNPVKDIINIVNPDVSVHYESVRILDLSGKTILTKNFLEPSEMMLEIDLSALATGMYFVEVVDDNGNKVVEKILKVD